MTDKEKMALLESRRIKMIENGKNIKSPGVLRKTERQIRNYEKRSSENNK